MKKGWYPCPQCIIDCTPPIDRTKHVDISNFKPTPLRKPTEKSSWEKNIDRRSNGSIKTKAQIMKREISSLCEEYGMHAEFVAGTVFVTTVAGEWFFDFNDRPIRLRHKNYTDLTKELGKSLNHYHLQKKSFSSPLYVIKYICEHDLALKRRVMSDIKSELATDEYLGDE
jgi:hypothetical protein